VSRAALLIAAALSCWCLPAAAEPSVAELFESGTQALVQGSTDDAIDRFELLADRGFVHPDASFNRGVAYIARARSNTSKHGDLGRAAAALAETLELRPSDREAEQALERVRAEISRRRARAGGNPVVAKPALLRAAVGLVPEQVYAVTGLGGSLLLTIALALRSVGRSERLRLGAAIAGFIGGGLLLLGGALGGAARHLRNNAEPAVVVVNEARLLDQGGTPLGAKDVEHVAVPEGASVYVRERQGRLAKVEWGTIRGWVPQGDLRLLARAR
jgi:hypothetical protein